MAQTVSVKTKLIRWAIDRSQLPMEVLTKAFPKLDEWLRGDGMPTLKQLERFASKTMTPFGYLFLDSPPDERLPIPDFRTVGDSPIDRPSPNLLETIQAMQRRQAWMREYVVGDGQDPLEFVGSARSVQNVNSLAVRIKEALGLNADWAEIHKTWEAAHRTLCDCADRIGILVARCNVVGLNNHRRLDPEEFRGFVLCDDYAPLIFVNAADYKSAQMFTLAHELVHLWIGKGGLFNLINMMPHPDATERFCNQVAAEFLVPGQKLAERWNDVKGAPRPFRTLGRQFKVSPVAVARRALDMKLIKKAEFLTFYERDQEEWRKRRGHEKGNRKKRHANFYDAQTWKLGRRMAHAVAREAHAGRLLYRDAYRLTDLKRDTFDRFADHVTQRMVDERR